MNNCNAWTARTSAEYLACRAQHGAAD